MLTLVGVAKGKRGFRTRERFLLLPEDLGLVPEVRYVLLISDDLKSVYKVRMICHFTSDSKVWPWR